MLKQATVLILVVASSACSNTQDGRQANDIEKYIDVPAEQGPLVIPNDLISPDYGRDYNIPPLGESADRQAVGLNVDIRPPLQVLPIAEGTYLEEGRDGIRVGIESLNNGEDLKQEIFSQLNSFLSNENIAVSEDNFTDGIITTDWVQQELDPSVAGDSETQSMLKLRYQFVLQIAPHGRSGDIQLSLLEHELSSGSGQTSFNDYEQNRVTTEFLNQAITYLASSRNLQSSSTSTEAEQDIVVNLMEPEGENAYWLAQSSQPQVWERLRTILPDLGFEVTDIDNSKGLFYLSVVEDTGFWSNLLGGSGNSPVPPGSYHMLVEQAADPAHTSIQLLDIDDNPIDNDVIVDLSPRLISQINQ